MNVGELIAFLETLAPDMRVLMNQGDFGGFNDLDPGDLMVRRVVFHDNFSERPRWLSYLGGDHCFPDQYRARGIAEAEIPPVTQALIF